jgi:hypothetical protein
MDLESLTALLAGYPGTLIVRGGGDVYAIHDPDGTYEERPRHGWATVVTSDAHDAASHLDRPGIGYRLNIGLPRERFGEVVDAAGDHDLTAVDVLVPHPVYAGMGWVCVIDPDTTWPQVRGLLAEAHAHAARLEAARRPRRHREGRT